MQYRYIQSTLLKDEELIYIARPHWIIFSPAVITLFLALLFYYYGPVYFSFRSSLWGGYQLFDVISAVVALVGLYWLLTAYIMYRTAEYGITDKRVLMKTGWIRRNSLEIFLRKLEGINVNQTVTGRVLNYGTIVIIGTGGTQDIYYNVPDPLGFRKRVQQQTDLLIDEEDRH